MRQSLFACISLVKKVNHSPQSHCTRRTVHRGAFLLLVRSLYDDDGVVVVVVVVGGDGGGGY